MKRLHLDYDGALDELRGLLSAQDPLRHRGPQSLTESQVAVRIATAMRPARGVAAGGRGRRVRVAAQVAAALAVVVAAAIWAGGSDGPAATGTVVALRLPASSGDLQCVRPTVEGLRDHELAFLGTVESASPAEVTLRVTRWFAGAVDAETVTLKTVDGAAATEFGATEFVGGSDYLVAASDGLVEPCGFSGPATESRLADYDKAFSK